MIKAVPLAYNGTRFRSTLEADWAATFDALGWYYEYEPWAVDLGDGIRYLCDFHLPAQNVWCEVKGGHNQRMHKTRRFHKAVTRDRPAAELVVILRAAGPGGNANWHHITGYRHPVHIAQCANCNEWSFNAPRDDQQTCRNCGKNNGIIRDFGAANRTLLPAARYEALKAENGTDYVKEIFGTHGRLAFARAPRPGRAA